MPSEKTPFEFLPDRTIKIRLGYLVTFVILLVSMSVGYGGYKAGFQNQVQEVTQAKQEITQLRTDLDGLRYDMGRLKQSLDDLKDSIDRKR